MTDTTAAFEGAPRAPEAAAALFGDRLDLARRYVATLADTGVGHGLIGPREVPRLWDRHVLNCAVVAELLPTGSTVLDVGSGAGLPGLCLAIARPDLHIVLVEPMSRRTDWLSTTISDLGLEHVEVVRARAEELHGRRQARYVTARAVARLNTLARWCLPLVEPEGAFLALKGQRADEEVAEARADLLELGVADVEVVTVGASLVPPGTTVVRLAAPARSLRTTPAWPRRRDRTRGQGRRSGARTGRPHR